MFRLKKSHAKESSLNMANSKIETCRSINQQIKVMSTQMMLNFTCVTQLHAECTYNIKHAIFFQDNVKPLHRACLMHSVTDCRPI